MRRKDLDELPRRRLDDMLQVRVKKDELDYWHRRARELGHRHLTPFVRELINERLREPKDAA